MLEELRETAGDEAFQEIAETFTEQIEVIVNRLGARECSEDLKYLERNSHELAGAVGTFSAPALASHARNLMASCRAGNHSEARDLVASLLQAVDETLEAFSAYRRSLS